MKHFLWVGLVTVLALGAFVSTSGVSAGDSVHLAYKYEEGSSQSYKIKFNQEVDLGQYIMTALVDMEITESCIGVSDSTFTIEWTFDKVDASRTMFNKMQTDPMADNLVQQKVMFELDPSGDVTEVRPVSYIEGWDQAEETVIRIIEACFPPLPDKDVSVGEEWDLDETETSDEGTKVTSSGKYKYKENKKEGGRKCAKLEGEVVLKISGQVAGPKGAMEADGGGKGKMEIYFDAAAGIVVKIKGRIGIDMTMTPLRGGDSIETSVGFETEKKLK